ncbi:MAG: SH3 domain-containing protein [Lachnospiraceae bacterium]|jgi:uncharacterized protein YgiM (DUF1202 family)|nr:SH3 domain-containing protein [Lachnospiraceae bacterium]
MNSTNKHNHNADSERSHKDTHFTSKYPQFSRKEIMKTIRPFTDWVVKHTNIVLPVVLVVSVLATVIIGLNANERAELEAQAMTASVNDANSQDGAQTDATVPEIPLEQNKYPEINELFSTYYRAIADGDVVTTAAIDTDLQASNDKTALELIRIEKMADYIEGYETIDVYTKPGLVADSYVAYVCTEVRFSDVDALIPGLQTFYITKGADGQYTVKKDDLPPDVYEYVTAVSFQDDVVDLSNKVTVSYNDLIASNQELVEYIAYMGQKVNEDVGVALAQTVQPDITADSVAEEMGITTPGDENATDDQGTTGAEATPSPDGQAVISPVLNARATDVVNIRSSDSETADRLDKAEVGQEFRVLEQKGNGWSRVEYNDGDAYIKSEFLEIIGEESTDTDNEATTEQDAGGEDAGQAAESADGVTTDGTVKVIESVRVRSIPGTDGDSLGTVYSGEELDLIEQMDNGWTKVTYDGEIGYVKSEYVE